MTEDAHVDDLEGPSPDSGEDTPQATFRATVEEGVRRLERDTPALLATGLVGGFDVSIGVFGLLVGLHLTDSTVIGSLAFSIGFIALTLASSELFTENFLVPFSAVVTGKASWTSVARLWAGTLIMNLVGGWIIAAIVISGFPELRGDAIELGRHFAELGVGWRSFASGMVAGGLITVMTWMIEGTSSPGAKIVASATVGFLLAAGEVNHCIVASIEMFAGLVAGAPGYGYLDWLGMFAWAALANAVGGIGFVTLLRLVQVRDD